MTQLEKFISLYREAFFKKTDNKIIRLGLQFLEITETFCKTEESKKLLEKAVGEEISFLINNGKMHQATTYERFIEKIQQTKSPNT